MTCEIAKLIIQYVKLITNYYEATLKRDDVK